MLDTITLQEMVLENAQSVKLFYDNFTVITIITKETSKNGINGFADATSSFFLENSLPKGTVVRENPSACSTEIECFSQPLL